MKNQPYVVVVVWTEDMEGNDRITVIGPFDTEQDAERGKPPFLRSTKRQIVQPLSAPESEA